ncbi:MAG: hypothetical protein IT249_11820 [Chitinophagaceae bacterium]|nr:hypothetical protein [Chitinophagaceae bacterium]
MNNTAKYIIVLYALTLGLLNSACNNKLNFVQVDHLGFYLPGGWAYKKTAPDKYEITKDTIKIIVNILADSSFTDIHPRSPEEFIQSEYPNFLTGFAFNKSDVIYTAKENIEKIREQNKSKVNIEENPHPILRKYLKVNDSLINEEGIDYLCQFQIDSEKKWVPVKLPDFYKNYLFKFDTTGKIYKKFYYPINGDTGRIGVLIRDYNHRSVLSARSSLITDRLIDYNTMLKIFSSMQIIN